MTTEEAIKVLEKAIMYEYRCRIQNSPYPSTPEIFDDIQFQYFKESRRLGKIRDYLNHEKDGSSNSR